MSEGLMFMIFVLDLIIQRENVHNKFYTTLEIVKDNVYFKRGFS